MLQGLPHPLRRLAPVLACAMLAGCAGDGTPVPSLAPRPIESIAIDEPVPAEPVSNTSVPGTADPALDEAAARALASAEAAVAPFDAQLARARDAANAAKGAAAGSEPWIVAQQAISRLVELRGPVDAATATLDRIRVEAAGRQPPVDTRRIDEAAARAAAIEQRQNDAYRAVARALTPA